MIVNFKTREISRGTRKLAQTHTLIKKKKKEKKKRHHDGTTGLKRTLDSSNKNKIVLHCNLINRLYLSQVTTAHIQS